MYDSGNLWINPHTVPIRRLPLRGPSLTKIPVRNDSPELAIVGGGLAGGLLALALVERHPDIDLMLIEAGDRLGGNHVWSFFDGDLDADGHALVAPLVAHRWAGHDVRFPALNRTLDAGYNSITSERFDAVLRERLGDRIVTGAPVRALVPGTAAIENGRTINAAAVVDARAQTDLTHMRCGWQKFVGQSLRLAEPHGLDRPVIMDATVDQLDGYRFVYLLPFDDREVFVEDTYYSDYATIDPGTVRTRIADYAAAQGWRVEAVTREEKGALPVAMSGDFDLFWPADDPVARIGSCAGLFHPTTGYSLPDAVALARRLAELWPMDGARLATVTRDWAAERWRTRGYYRMLDRMLFRAAQPAERYRIFERFYALPEPLIARFYAARSTLADQARILCGRPPVPIRGAMRAMLNVNA